MMKFHIVSAAVLFFISQTAANNGFPYEIPPGCEGKDICDVKPKNYPQDLIDEWIQTVSNDLEIKDDISDYEDKIERDENNCDVRYSKLQPFIVNTTSTPKLVVQNERFFVQKIQHAECVPSAVSIDQGCFTDAFSKPMGKCVPTKGSILMYLYNPYNKKFEMASVEFPACCSCSLNS